MVDHTLDDERGAEAGLLDDTAPARAVAEARASAGAEAPGADALGRRLDRFTLLEQLGEGGMGEVYAAYDERLDRKVAVKVLRSSRIPTDHDRARLQREARALAQLSHPNIVAVFDTGVYEGEVYLAMEFVRGQTLDAWLGEEPRSWSECLRVFIGAGRGLAAMHELGLVHRDFKPTNVLVDERGVPRLIDFGLVRIAGSEPAPEHEGGVDVDPAARGLEQGLTRTGALMGTPRYMSPEQFSGARVGPASDQFSLCVALYQALYGEDPFASETFDQRARLVGEAERPEPPRRPELPAMLGALVCRGLEREPEARWPDLTELCDALDAILASNDQGEDEPGARRTQRRVILGMAALTAGILSTGLIMVRQGAIGFTALNATLTDAVVLMLTALFALGLRKRWQSSRRARRLVGFFFLVILTYAFQDLLGLLAGRSLYHTVLGNLGCLVIYCGAMSRIEDRSFGWAAVWGGACVTLMVIDVDNYFAHYTAGNLGSALIATLMFRRRPVRELDDRSTRSRSRGRRSSSRSSLTSD